MARPYTADTSDTMRILGVLVVMLALAGPASAATPRFGIFDLQSDLANASKNDFGDVKVASRELSLAAKAPDATLVRCARDCRFGPGWLASRRARASGHATSFRPGRIGSAAPTGASR